MGCHQTVPEPFKNSTHDAALLGLKGDIVDDLDLRVSGVVDTLHLNRQIRQSHVHVKRIV